MYIMLNNINISIGLVTALILLTKVVTSDRFIKTFTEAFNSNSLFFGFLK